MAVFVLSVLLDYYLCGITVPHFETNTILLLTGYLSKPTSGHRRKSSAGSHRDLLFSAMFNVQEDFSKTTTSKLR